MTHKFLAFMRRGSAVALIIVLALALLPTAALAGTLDQSQTDISGAEDGIAGPASSIGPISEAQTFTAGRSGKLDQVDLYLSRDSTSSSPITIEIRNVDSGGVPDSTVLATSSLTGVDQAAWYSAAFASPASVTAGTQYAIVAYTASDSAYLWRLAGTTDPYPGGNELSSLASPPSTWTARSDDDFAFKTYVRPLTADLSLAIVGPDTAARKSTVTYILTVQNVGPDTATNVVLTDNLPYGVQLTAVTTSQGSCTPPSKGVTTVTCNLGDIASGGETNSAVTITVKANVSNANLNFVANVSSDTLDPNLDNNSASFSTWVSK